MSFSLGNDENGRHILCVCTCEEEQQQTTNNKQTNRQTDKHIHRQRTEWSEECQGNGTVVAGDDHLLMWFVLRMMVMVMMELVLE